MAHRIAELMGTEALAKSDAEREDARTKTQALILELWTMRAALPGRADPTARLKAAIAVLEKLSENERYYYQHASVGDVGEQHALKAHHNTSTIIRNLALVKLAAEFAEYDADETNLPLSGEEKHIRQLFDEAMASTVSRRIFVVSPGGETTEPRSNVEMLREKIVTAIDEAMISLNGVRESIASELSPTERSGEKKVRERSSTARNFAGRRKSI